jgi:hypothetical protein
VIGIKKLDENMKVPGFRIVGEEKLLELSLGQPTDVVGVVWRKVNPLLIAWYRIY